MTKEGRFAAAAAGPGERRIGRARLMLAAAPLCALLALLGWLLVRSQAAEQDALEERFRARGHLTVGFVDSYLQDLAGREGRQAGRLLSSPEVDGAVFGQVVQAFEFEAAVLLDDRGRALHAWPPSADVVGKDLASQYDHLRAAVGGQVGVSGVVPSAVRREPVVAVAVPFETGSGRRVISGAFAASATPLGGYLRNAAPISGQQIMIVDGAGAIVASSLGDGAAGDGLRSTQPQLEAAIGDSAAGTFEAGGEQHYFTVAQTARAPWRVVSFVPTASLYSPLQGGQIASWLVFTGLVACAALAWVTLWRLFRSRAMLDMVSRIDLVTGMYNRRHLHEQLTTMLSAARRQQKHLGLLMIDIDHFKRVNDTYGHAVGDKVLRTVAERIESTLRAEDVAGRWGGEEYLAILPVTSLAGARTTGERIRAAIGQPIVLDRGVSIAPTVSVGCAIGMADTPDHLLARADEAMYAAKAAGRDQVVEAAMV